MIIEISLKNDEVAISLKNNKITVDFIKLKENKNLSAILLSGIDMLLRKNKLTKRDIRRVSVKNSLPDSYTSSRIAKSLEKSFNFSRKTM